MYGILARVEWSRVPIHPARPTIHFTHEFSKIQFPQFQTICLRIIYPYFNFSPQDYPTVFWLKYVLTIYISWLYTHKLHNQLQLSCKFLCAPCFSLKFLMHNLHNMLTILFLLCQDFLLSIAYLFLNKHCRLQYIFSSEFIQILCSPTVSTSVLLHTVNTNTGRSTYRNIILQ